MSLFSSRPRDPIEEEMRRLQAKEKDLARQLEKLERNPILQRPEEEPRRLVVIPPQEDPQPVFRNKKNHPSHRLRVENRRIKTRFITACILLAILALVIYRVWRG